MTTRKLSRSEARAKRLEVERAFRKIIEWGQASGTYIPGHGSRIASDPDGYPRVSDGWYPVVLGVRDAEAATAIVGTWTSFVAPDEGVDVIKLLEKRDWQEIAHLILSGEIPTDHPVYWRD